MLRTKDKHVVTVEQAVNLLGRRGKVVRTQADGSHEVDGQLYSDIQLIEFANLNR